MNNPPVFSIIIPTYNSGNSLKTCLDSIVNQSFSDFEVLLMDGLSTDNTVAIAAQYGDSRIRIFSRKDEGIYDAMNSGIRLSKGKWLYFLGSDDSLYNNRVLETMSLQLSSRWDVVYGNVVSSAYKEKYDGQFDYLKLYKQNISHQSLFFKRSLFDKTGYYNLKYKILSDYDHNMKWFLSFETKIKYVDMIVANYGTNGCSTVNNDEVFQRDRGYNYIRHGFNYLPKKQIMTVCRNEMSNKNITARRKFVIILLTLCALFRV